MYILVYVSLKAKKCSPLTLKWKLIKFRKLILCKNVTLNLHFGIFLLSSWFNLTNLTLSFLPKTAMRVV